MTLIVCYECGKEISDAAMSCPHCGAPAFRPPLTPKKPRRNMTTEEIVAWSVGLPPIPLLLMFVVATAMGSSEAQGIVVLFLIAFSAWALALAPIVIGDRLGSRRGSRNTGAVIGFLTGWIGVLIYWLAIPLKRERIAPPPMPPWLR